MIRRPPRSTRTDTLLPYTTLFRSPEMRGAHARKGFAMDKGLGMSSHAPVFGLRLGQALSGLNGFAARSIKRRLILVLGLVLVLQALVGASQLAGMQIGRAHV